MADLLSSIFSNTDTLTPMSILEIFVFFGLIELIGILFSWVRGGR